MIKFPETLKQLIASLRKLPGVGQKTAERYAFQLISWNDKDRKVLAQVLDHLKETLELCPICGALNNVGDCTFCTSTTRDKKLLCIVSSPKDIFTLEQTGIYNGLYHVMPGLISPLDGMDASDLQLDKLLERVQSSEIKEVILALDSTVEGDATSLFLKKELERYDLFVSRLAMGIPLGSTLDYIDEGTLSKALSSRSPL